MNLELPVVAKLPPTAARPSVFGRWSRRLAVLAAFGFFAWALLHRATTRAPRKSPAPQTPAQQQPSEKPRLTLEPELVS